MIKILLLIVVLSSMGCGGYTTVELTKYTEDHIFYTKDTRTGFCFASNTSAIGSYDVQAFSAVPCTAEVLNLINSHR